MNKIGRRIYYDNSTGEVLVITSERQGDVEETSIENDINTYLKLIERNRDTFDYIELVYGQYREDFQQATSHRVNLETKQLIFSYDNNNEDEQSYQEPLSEKATRLEKENQLLTQQLKAQAERSDFIEDLVAELATVVYE